MVRVYQWAYRHTSDLIDHFSGAGGFLIDFSG
jgi:hypothetical protein